MNSNHHAQNSPTKMDWEVFPIPGSKVNLSPTKGSFSAETISRAHEIILNSTYAGNVSRWHWAILKQATDGTQPDMTSESFETNMRNAIALSKAVWDKSYTDLENIPRGKKRKFEDSEGSDDSSDEDNIGRSEVKTISLSDMAASGFGFKLDWNSEDHQVVVLNEEQLDKAKLGQLSLSPDFKKENIRLVSKPKSPGSLRVRLLKKLQAAKAEGDVKMQQGF